MPGRLPGDHPRDSTRATPSATSRAYARISAARVLHLALEDEEHLLDPRVGEGVPVGHAFHLRRPGGARDDLEVTDEGFARLLVRYTARVSKRVLIVEDDPAIIQLLQEFFRGLEHGHDYEVETATDGVKAIPLLRHTQFDLVLLDMRMPRMDGLELLKKMRQNKIRVPVLMVTANDDAEAAGEALSAGVFAYVPKPFDFPRLEHLVALALSGGPPADAPPST